MPPVESTTTPLAASTLAPTPRRPAASLATQSIVPFAARRTVTACIADGSVAVPGPAAPVT